MRTMIVAGAGYIGLLLGLGGIAVAAGVTPQADKQAAASLRPLSEADLQRTRETGCQLSFDDARGRTLVYVIRHDFMVRTRAGLQVCRITDRQFGALSGRGGTQSCGGMRINVRRSGRVVGHQESDSASSPAVLTVTGRGRPWTVRGQWGSAC
jgi:hypothetical protein